MSRKSSTVSVEASEHPNVDSAMVTTAAQADQPAETSVDNANVPAVEAPKAHTSHVDQPTETPVAHVEQPKEKSVAHVEQPEATVTTDVNKPIETTETKALPPPYEDVPKTKSSGKTWKKLSHYNISLNT